jgi:hypothetical protein
MRVEAVWAVLTAVILAPTSAMAQDGAIAGRVLDVAGDTLPGVTIEAGGSALAEPRVAVTDRQGRYRVAELPPGDYTVIFSLPGFRSVVRDGIDVGSGVAARVDAELVVGLDDDDTIDVWGETRGGAAALRCTFHPNGRIADCRRVFVPGFPSAR